MQLLTARHIVLNDHACIRAEQRCPFQQQRITFNWKCAS